MSIALDDRATASYIRRTLLAHHTALSSGTNTGPPKPIHELLPHLTSSDAVDLQIYGMIAVLLKEFVATWYGKVTPDHQFVEEILKIIAHSARELEERARRVDWEGWFMDEAPTIIEDHIKAFRISRQQKPISNTPRRIYHALHPHPSLAPVPDDPSDIKTIVDQQENERAWRHLLAQGVLTLLLPVEDLQNGCLRELVTEIVAEIILGNILGSRLCEGWTLWQLITNLIQNARTSDQAQGKAGQSGKKKSASSERSDSGADGNNPNNRLEKFGLLNGPAEDMSAHTAANSHDVGPQTFTAMPLSLPTAKSFTNSLWTLLNYGALVITAGRAVLVTLLSASSLPPRRSYGHHSLVEVDDQQDPKGPASPVPRPLLSMGIWGLVANVIELPFRMPWLAGFVSLMQWTAVRGKSAVGCTDGTLDRLLAHRLHTKILDTNRIPSLLRTARHILFPTNTFPRHKQPVPTEEQVKEIRARCASTILNTIPITMRSVYFAVSEEDEQLNIIDGWLGTLEDAYCNRHAVFALTESLVVRLMPELATEDVEMLLQDKMDLNR